MFEKTCTHVSLARVPVHPTMENWKVAIRGVDVQDLLALVPTARSVLLSRQLQWVGCEAVP